ncbi:MAG: hypothetical protein IT210_23970 [Armatimonadetes bacterium]|nr:hypothetical protein [Armatimonadota bacterium]
MSLFRFTGNPFVDAGIAGLCAAADKNQPEALEETSIHEAVKRLVRLMTSDEAFKATDEQKAFVTSALPMVFTMNADLSNPSNKSVDTKTQKYKERIAGRINALFGIPKEAPGFEENGICFVCGRSPVTFLAGKTDFPLMDSVTTRINFHSCLEKGHPICAACALALEFFPFSVLRTGTSGKLWFVHSPDPKVCIPIASEFTWHEMHRCQAAHRPLRFYGDWHSVGEAGAIVSLVRFMTIEKGDEAIEGTPFPIRAYVFSNDNRDASIYGIDIPNVLCHFFVRLKYDASAQERFDKEILHRTAPDMFAGFIRHIAYRLLKSEPIISACLAHEEEPNEGQPKRRAKKKDAEPSLFEPVPTCRLRGGWAAHRLYMSEVLQMTGKYIQTVETVAQRIHADEDRAKIVMALRLAGKNRTGIGSLLDLVQRKLMSWEEFYCLTPPNNQAQSLKARDYLLGALYDLQSREDIEAWDGRMRPDNGNLSPLIPLIENAGARLIESKVDHKRVVQGLRSRSISGIRGALLHAVERGGLGWADFIALCPPDPVESLFTHRDYLLAYLYDRLNGVLPLNELTEEDSDQ